METEGRRRGGGRAYGRKWEVKRARRNRGGGKGREERVRWKEGSR